MDCSTAGFPVRHQLTPGAYSNSCPLSLWCHPTISSSVVPFSCLQSFPASRSFPMSQFFISSGQSIGVSASTSVLPMNIQDCFPLGLTSSISLQSKGLLKSLQMVTAAFLLGRKAMTNLDSILKSYVFSSSHVWMWELDYKESWAPKNWCFGTVVLEETLESPVDCEEIQPVHSKGDQSWVFIGRTDAEVETPILWPPEAKSCLIGKDPDAGKDWRQEKVTTEDKKVGWHHQLDGHEFEQASELVRDREACRAAVIGSQRVRCDWGTELNSIKPSQNP